MADALYHRLWRARKRQEGPSRHGTVTGYTSYGCRCEACRKAKRAYDLGYKNRQRPPDLEQARIALALIGWRA